MTNGVRGQGRSFGAGTRVTRTSPVCYPGLLRCLLLMEPEEGGGCNRRKGVKMDLVLIILGAIVLFLVTVTHDRQ